MWTNRDWRSRYWGSHQGADLAAYSQWCNAVEGNTTFYALPGPETVEKWREATPEGFRFCFKLPREVTHERRLRGCDEIVEQFVARMAPIGERLGPIWIQLPPGFGAEQLGVLDRFLSGLPRDGLAWGVEVRNAAFEAEGPAEGRLHDVLHAQGVDRVIIDTRAVFAGPRTTSAEVEAWERKPRLRVRPIALGQHPMVRFIGQTDVEANPPWWQPWVDKVVAWLAEGRQPTVFIHTPDNVVAPELARRFHAEVRAKLTGLAPLPEPTVGDSQIELF